MKKILAATSIILSFTACNNEDQPEKDLSFAPINTPATTATDTANKSAVTNNSAIITAPQNITMPAMPAGATVTNTTTAPAPVAAGMNPAHGQPGHRCDIPVGAALSTPVAKPGATLANAPQVIPAPGATTVTKSAPVKTAPGMNPPHGEPGHRCDIPVGTALSQPVAPAATPAATPAITPAITPSAAADKQAETKQNR